MPDYLVAADVGASKTLLALARPGPAGWTWLTPPRRFPTPSEPADAADLISRGVSEIAATADPPRAVGLAIPGPVDSRGGIVSHLPNLGWHDVPFAAMLAQRLAAPVALDDDARLGALGEWSAGAGHGARGLAYVTVSTGIGCGLVLDGRPWAGGHGLAGEFGHIVVNPSGPRCGCGHRGCVESYAGGLALARAARRAWPRARLGDGAPAPRSAAEIFRLARGGDPVAAGLVERATEALATGLAAIAAVIDPELIVLGGSVALGQRRWLRSVVARSRQRCIAQTGASMRVVSATLAGLSALTGAAELSWRTASETA
jgi:glucokinase